MKVSVVFSIAILLTSAAEAAPTCIENSKCTFVDEYIRELSSFDQIMVQSQKEMVGVDPKSTQIFSISIHDGQRKINALKTNIGVLKSQPENDASKQLIASYELMIAMLTRLNQISSTILAGPRPGVDYGSLMAEVPKIRADLDDTTGSFLLMTNLAFAQLFALDKQDKNGHVELAITNAQRQELINHVNVSFGAALNHLGSKDAPWTVSSASILRTQLLKKFTAADDPIA